MPVMNDGSAPANSARQPAPAGVNSMKRLPSVLPLAFALVIVSGTPCAFGQERTSECDAKPIPPPSKVGGGREITVGTEYIGKIGDHDPRDRVRGTPCHICIVQLEKGKTYLIDMKGHGTGTDPYLLLEDDKGRHLDSDDDSGGQVLFGGEHAAKIHRYYGSEPRPYSESAQDARIAFSCKVAGKYRIIATTYDGAGGTYWLQVTTKEKEDEYDQLLLDATRYLMVDHRMLRITAKTDEDKDITTDKALNKAIKKFTKALEIHKSAEVFRDRGAAYTYLAQEAKSLEWYQAAEKDDKCAVSLNPNDGFSRYYLGADYLDLAKLMRDKAAGAGVDAAEKKAILEKAIGDYSKAIKSFTEAIELEKDKALYGRAGHGPRSSMLDDYYRLCGEAYRSRASAYKTLMKKEKEDQDYAKVHKLFHDAVTCDPTDARNVYELGRYHATIEKWDDAIENHREAVRLAKKDVKLKENDLELAKKAKTLYEGSPETLDGRNPVPETLEAYSGKEPEYYYQRNRQGDLYRQQVVAQFERNVAAAERTLALYLNTLAAAYAELKDFEQARAYQKQAIDHLPPGDPERKDFENRLEQYQRNQPFRQNGS
jgi:tetratricopeptide (TPR) repeat protein